MERTGNHAHTWFGRQTARERINIGETGSFLNPVATTIAGVSDFESGQHRNETEYSAYLLQPLYFAFLRVEENMEAR